MNKTELVNAVREKADLKAAQAKAAVEAVFQAIEEALVKGDKVTIPGFGTFLVKERKARTGVKPGTGEKLEIPARKAVGFKVGKELKERIR